MKISKATNSIYEFRRSMTENLHQKFISAIREIKSSDIDEDIDEDIEEVGQISSHNSSDDGFSEDCDYSCMRGYENFK